jgi:hypothetical protein
MNWPSHRLHDIASAPTELLTCSRSAVSETVAGPRAVDFAAELAENRRCQECHY